MRNLNKRLDILEARILPATPLTVGFYRVGEVPPKADFVYKVLPPVRPIKITRGE
ncbi:hypothetical protein [Vibrio agarivorans]|uniref:Uncharacterized protein n=1 Tax=Vibrio agarivorans TaxID=153622 RepID=A0ABT7Y0T1_9VIBR|nr:hypothetical protein [Vibrio agarivorans]MDN2481647.1 hypothetical protein [Vibrio agarivorans]